jgi:exodeoxyribonuclease VII large subunit
MEVFNSYQLCAEIAHSNLPVLTGIGHQRDTSVADMVANHALKTPTAVADFLIQQLLHFESDLVETFNSVVLQSQMLLQETDMELNRTGQVVERLANQTIAKTDLKLSNLEFAVNSLAKRSLRECATNVSHLERQIELLNPENILKKGYSITYKEGKPLNPTEKIMAGDEITTFTFAQKIESVVGNAEERV